MMLPPFALAATIAYLTDWFPKQTSAADIYGNRISALYTQEFPSESELQEEVVVTPLRTASPPIRPVLGVVILGALSSALFLFLRCIERSTSYQKEFNETGRVRLAYKDREGDGRKQLGSALAKGGSKNGGQTEGTSGGYEPKEGTDKKDIVIPYSKVQDIKADDGSHTPRTSDPFMEYPFRMPERGSPFPPADPPVTLHTGEVEERGSEMQEVLFFIRAGEQARNSIDTKGRSLSELLRQAFYCRQRNKNVEFGPDVYPEAASEFKRLVGEMEKIVFKFYGVGR